MLNVVYADSHAERMKIKRAMQIQSSDPVIQEYLAPLGQWPLH
jgi:hypothetical protein